MNTATAAPRPGEVLAGKYAVERVLGTGGMGVVVAATHLQLHQTVALKFMRPEALANQEAVERFLREARSAVRLRSQHVGRILDVGTLANGAPYIVMEYLDGSDLAQALKERKRMAAGAAADIVVQACDALAEAHAQGIVHRDLKPANLFLARSANAATVVKVLDFGISKARKDVDVSMTSTDSVLGSPAYMSPEQMRSARDVDDRTDVWSLGVILYEAVAGRLPFQSPSFPELCVQVMVGPTPPFPADCQAPAGFEAVVRRCLEKQPAQRYAGIAELASALAPFASPAAQILAAQIASVSAEPKPSMGVTASYPNLPRITTLGGSASQSVSALPPRHWPKWPLLAIPLLALAGIAAFLGGGSRGGTVAPPPPAALAPSPPPARPPDAAPPAPPDAAARPAAAPPPKPHKPGKPDAGPAPASQPSWDPIRLPE